MEKSKKRAERRWRSRCVWMRRLRQDWNEHGWERNPTYDYDFTGGNVVCYLSERTTLCDCFDLTNREAFRFKDTPNTSSFRRRDRDKYRDGRGDHLPVQERRAAPVERESFGRRKRRHGESHRKKLCCNCGYLLEVFEVRNGTGVGYPRSRHRACPNCRVSRATAGEFYSS